MKNNIPPLKSLHHQRGISSFIVMMVLILSLISVLSAQRIGILNEAFMGSDSDAQRAFAAAEAVLQDAKLDIRGTKDLGGGVAAPCVVGGIGCRTSGNIAFPQSGNSDYGIAEIRAYIPIGKNCVQGICAPLSPLTPFWTNASTFAAMKTQAAKYGQFTDANASGNAILASKAWYWVEVFRYNVDENSSNGNPYIPSKSRPYVFRITAIAEGNKSGTLSVLQTYYVPNKMY